MAKTVKDAAKKPQTAQAPAQKPANTQDAAKKPVLRKLSKFQGAKNK